MQGAVDSHEFRGSCVNDAFTAKVRPYAPWIRLNVWDSEKPRVRREHHCRGIAHDIRLTTFLYNNAA